MANKEKKLIKKYILDIEKIIPLYQNKRLCVDILQGDLPLHKKYNILDTLDSDNVSDDLEEETLTKQAVLNCLVSAYMQLHINSLELRTTLSEPKLLEIDDGQNLIYNSLLKHGAYETAYYMGFSNYTKNNVSNTRIGWFSDLIKHDNIKNDMEVLKQNEYLFMHVDVFKQYIHVPDLRKLEEVAIIGPALLLLPIFIKEYVNISPYLYEADNLVKKLIQILTENHCVFYKDKLKSLPVLKKSPQISSNNLYFKYFAEYYNKIFSEKTYLNCNELGHLCYNLWNPHLSVVSRLGIKLPCIKMINDDLIIKENIPPAPIPPRPNNLDIPSTSKSFPANSYGKSLFEEMRGVKLSPIKNMGGDAPRKPQVISNTGTNENKSDLDVLFVNPTLPEFVSAIFGQLLAKDKKMQITFGLDLITKFYNNISSPDLCISLYTAMGLPIKVFHYRNHETIDAKHAHDFMQILQLIDRYAHSVPDLIENERVYYIKYALLIVSLISNMDENIYEEIKNDENDDYLKPIMLDLENFKQEKTPEGYVLVVKKSFTDPRVYKDGEAMNALEENETRLFTTENSVKRLMDSFFQFMKRITGIGGSLEQNKAYKIDNYDFSKHAYVLYGLCHCNMNDSTKSLIYNRDASPVSLCAPLTPYNVARLMFIGVDPEEVIDNKNTPLIKTLLNVIPMEDNKMLCLAKSLPDISLHAVLAKLAKDVNEDLRSEVDIKKFLKPFEMYFENVDVRNLIHRMPKIDSRNLVSYIEWEKHSNRNKPNYLEKTMNSDLLKPPKLTESEDNPRNSTPVLIFGIISLLNKLGFKTDHEFSQSNYRLFIEPKITKEKLLKLLIDERLLNTKEKEFALKIINSSNKLADIICENILYYSKGGSNDAEESGCMYNLLLPNDVDILHQFENHNREQLLQKNELSLEKIFDIDVDKIGGLPVDIGQKDLEERIEMLIDSDNLTLSNLRRCIPHYIKRGVELFRGIETPQDQGGDIINNILAELDNVEENPNNDIVNDRNRHLFSDVIKNFNKRVLGPLIPVLENKIAGPQQENLIKAVVKNIYENKTRHKLSLDRRTLDYVNSLILQSHGLNHALFDLYVILEYSQSLMAALSQNNFVDKTEKVAEWESIERFYNFIRPKLEMRRAKSKEAIKEYMKNINNLITTPETARELNQAASNSIDNFYNIFVA